MRKRTGTGTVYAVLIGVLTAFVMAAQGTGVTTAVAIGFAATLAVGGTGLLRTRRRDRSSP